MQINEMQLMIRYIYFYIIKHAINAMQWNIIVGEAALTYALNIDTIKNIALT